jgi:hypothetical protein
MQSAAARLRFLLGLVSIALSRVALAQTPAALPADVGTIVDIVRASYEVINGPAGAPRQWRRDSTLYTPGATFVALREVDGKVQAVSMTPEDFRRQNDSSLVARGLFETEIGRRIERFGNVAQVRSVAIARRTPSGPAEARWVNYFQLYWDGARWWIAGMVWDEERANSPIPKEWVGRWAGAAR